MHRRTSLLYVIPDENKWRINYSYVLGFIRPMGMTITAKMTHGRSQCEMEHQEMCADNKKVPEALAQGLTFVRIRSFYHPLLLDLTG
jgi:hypothetical protein